MIWLILWFVIPTVIVFLMAFKPVDAWGGIGSGWTLQTIRELSNPNYPEIRVTENDDFSIWGVVTYVIHKTRR